MKYLLCILVVLCFNCSRVLSQDDGVPTFSQECFEVAKAKAGDTISGPTLTGMGTFPIPKAPLFGSSHFAIQTAKATAWLFTFRSTINNASAVILSYKSKATGSCVAIEIAVDSSKVSPYPINEQHIRSDSLMMELATNNTFLSILAQHNELQGDSLFVVSSNADDSNTFPPDANLWITDFAYNGGKLVCVYDASNKSQSVCQNFALASVSDGGDAAQPQCQPSPASTYALVNFPLASRSQYSNVRIFSIQGEEIMDMRSMAINMNSGIVVIPVTQLKNGVYLIRCDGPNSSISLPLVVAH